MTAMNWERSDLVRVSGQSSSVVSQWLGNSTKVIKSIGKQEAAEALEAESGFCALWIAKGLGPMRKPQANPERPVAEGATSGVERSLIDDFRELLPEDQEAFATQIRARADQMRKHTAMVLARSGIGGAAPSDQNLLIRQLPIGRHEPMLGGISKVNETARHKQKADKE